MNRTSLIALIAVIAILSGCKLADLQTRELKEEGLKEKEQAHGRALLEKAWKAQGMDKLSAFSTYTVTAEDHWRGLLGKVGKVWPESRSQIELRYATGTFDSQVLFLDGKKQGMIAGLQSWQYYEIEPGTPISFKEKANKRRRFGLSAFHYFFEMTDRLKRAPIVTAMGQQTWQDELYDKVFVTWQDTKAHLQHDQYVLWINRETGLLDYAEFTIRDTYFKTPGWKKFYGSIHYSDFREIEGIKIPFQQYVFINSPKKDQKYLHKLTVFEFAFDSFDVSMLQPNPDIEFLGDAKIDR